MPVYDLADPASWEKIPYPVPDKHELVEDYWIFVLFLPDLSEQVYWVIIDRAGEKPAYVYGSR